MQNIKEKVQGLIQIGENFEVEFKSGRGGIPASLWESYSAFANTNGGTIVLGIQEKNGNFVLDGLKEETVRKYQKIFWDCAHNKGKVSACIPQEEGIRIEEIDGSYILICHIPRASYEQRPVYITTNPFGNTYRRNHESDYLCTDDEVRRMFSDADHDRHSYDSRILQGYDFNRDIDKESLDQYRQTFASLQPTHPWVGISDMDFLKKIGAYATDFESGKEGFTLAGILMFGKYDSIINNAGDPTFFVDYRESLASDIPNLRWTNRIYPDGMWEANLYQFYIKVYNRLIQSLPRPFMIKDGIRQEETPTHDAVREALINCIIHQDLAAMGNIVIERTDNALIFRNPGTMLVSKQQYYEGGRSICRNPVLQKMFMRLGRAEKAGSGVDKIVSGWHYSGWPTPAIIEETRPDYVVLTLHIGKPHKKIPQENPIRKPHKKTSQEAPTRTTKYKVYKKENREGEILEFCLQAKSCAEILEYFGLKDRKNLMETYLNPLISKGLLRMTEPDTPRSRNQKYKTTKGKS